LKPWELKVSVPRKIKLRTCSRKLRVRERLKNNASLPRLTVFRSLKNISAQIVDDHMRKTLVSCSSLELKNLSGDKKTIAKSVGKELGKRAIEKGIKEVVFDRGSYLYHGRVKSLAEGLREGGLKV